MSRKAKIGIFAFFLLCLSLITITRLTDKDKRLVARSGLYMGTTVEIKVSLNAGEDRIAADRAISEAFNEIGRIESVFSVFRDESEISRINCLKAGEALEISDEVFGLIARSIEFSRITGGAFDITVKPLVDLWKAAKSSGVIPEAEAIGEAKARAGCDNIVLNEADKTVSFKKDGVMLDMGGIAKGYATDRAVKVLKGNGIRNAVVNSGGDMYCLGRRSKKALWKIGIQHPRKRGEVFSNIFLEDAAADTSGDYEKYFTLDGKRFSHIIDPRTGYPVGDNVVSATVVAKDSLTADALATALCVLGPEKGLAAIRSFPGVDAAIVSNEDGHLKVRMSEGFGKYTDDHRFRSKR